MLSPVISSLKPIILMASLCGFRLFTLNQKTATITITKLNIFSIVITVLLNFFLSNLYWHSKLFRVYFFLTEIVQVSIPIMITIDHLCSVIGMWWNCHKRHEIATIFIQLSEIDDELMEFGVTINYKKIQREMTIFFGTIMGVVYGTSFICVIAQQSYGVNTQMLTTMFGCWVNFLIVTYVSQCTIGMMSIGLRFEKIVEIFERKLQNIKEAHKKIDKNEHKVYKNLQKIHLKIVECVKIFNSVYGIPMFISFGNLFAWTCMSTFTIAILIKQNNLSLIIISGLGFSLGFTAFSLIFIINAAERTSVAKEMAVERLYRLMCEDASDKNENLNFISQILNTNVNFSCKFFDFNWKLMFKVRKKL